MIDALFFSLKFLDSLLNMKNLQHFLKFLFESKNSWIVAVQFFYNSQKSLYLFIDLISFLSANLSHLSLFIHPPGKYTVVPQVYSDFIVRLAFFFGAHSKLFITNLIHGLWHSFLNYTFVRSQNSIFFSLQLNDPFNIIWLRSQKKEG